MRPVDSARGRHGIGLDAVRRVDKLERDDEDRRQTRFRLALVARRPGAGAGARLIALFSLTPKNPSPQA